MKLNKIVCRIMATLGVSLIFVVPSVAQEQTCFETFSRSICSVDLYGREICGAHYSDNQIYVQQLEKVFQHSSEISRKLMCSLSKIVVVDDLGDATGVYYPDSARVEVLGSIFEDDTSIELLQIIDVYDYFEEDDNRYQVTSAEQLLDRNFVYAPEGLLFYVITHELGHHLDFVYANGMGFSCVYTPKNDNWFAAPFGQELREILLLDRDPLPRDTTGKFYGWLNKSTFVSPYSLKSDYEDFAETFTYYEIFVRTTAFSQMVVDGVEVFSTRSSAFTESKAEKYEMLAFLIDAVLADDEFIGFKMLMCDLPFLKK